VQLHNNIIRLVYINLL